jgi:hypothetical protein
MNEAIEITEPHIDADGNRFWLHHGNLLCAPIFADGEVDMDNAGEPAWGQIGKRAEAKCRRIQHRLITMGAS